MKISSIVDIIDGELLSTPSITSINSIKTESEKVKTADLFIARNIDDLNIAIKNGAYAVIFEEDFSVSDTEVAFIKVRNIEKALLSIFRFKLANKNIKAYLSTDISYDLLKSLFSNNHKDIFILPKNIEKIFRFIDNIEDNSIIISNNKEVLNSIFSSYEIFDKEIDKHSIRNLTIHSLFELSFSYKNRFYNRIKIAALYIKSLINCLEFFKDYDIDLTKLNRFKNLKAIFLDKNLNIVDFGKSDKFLISQNNLDLVEFEIKFIKEYYKYAKAIFITNSYLDYLNKDEQIIIKNIEDLKNILDNIEFNSIYLVGFDYLTVLDYFSKPKNLPTLF
ncbi:hypothetical protein AAX26_01244 [Aliarcobacter thereius]|uniref:Peptidoglycan synthetase n=2 Tax=Aliarcobacter thereius TaxID=544718 RepID=A0A1C0B710_9BACT|nr:peptidoglycan synthetase [Aliarcobacter thereius]OCL86936.1 hypothetical protein AAX26_01244 [Aliarcobacter thereius]OCL91117.1 hypothetical protein AAX25_01287 [Aliarcobacter thereius]OCL96030.1 hypothetical protein AA347_01519 [Aliarcobacter thereius LMG 24486]OCL99361.1 hypothetical protein AAX29_01173 [Aliarcobacter thereius]QBF15998.1 hypothetical protein ATH_0931 [Aliarcobacter thereius LMG 24486]